ncbi:MAG: protein translocase subunit SecF [Acidimicrobiia bacterium]
MSLFTDLYWGRTTFDVVASRRRWFALSAILLLVSAGVFALRGGFDLSVDFQGGTVVTIANPDGASVAEVRDRVNALGITGARVQESGGGTEMRVQTTRLDADREQALVEALAGVTGSDPSDAGRQSVGPTFGRQIADAAIRALIVFLAVAALYMTWRLQWKMALVAIAALLHDLLATAGIYAIVGLEVSPATVIAVLTVLGYSLYDTVILFDRVLESVKERGDRQTLTSIVNESFNGILMRSINTTLTTLVPIVSLLLVGAFLLGATTLRAFAVALLIGIAIGTYSTLFVAGPLYAAWGEREDRWQRVRLRLDRKAGTTAPVRATPADAGDRPRIPSTGTAIPRPPRKRRKSR